MPRTAAGRSSCSMPTTRHRSSSAISPRGSPSWLRWDADIRVRFWGTRGSISAAGPETLRYGGNTPCVEVTTDDGTLLVFDCGTGARKLGLALANKGPVRVHLLLSHTHADHIQGLPFFLPAFTPGSHITVYGPSGVDRRLPTAVGGTMDYAYFPVPLESLPTKVGWGHSTVEYAVDIALAARAKTLVLFHHDPDRDDSGVDDLTAVAASRVAASKRPLNIVAAAEGEELLLAEVPYARTTDVE